MEETKNKKTIIIIAVSVVIIAVIIGGYFIGKGSLTKDPEKESSSSSSSSSSNVDEPSNNGNHLIIQDYYHISEKCEEPSKDKVCIIPVTMEGFKEEIRLLATGNEVEPDAYDYRSLAVNGINIVDEEYLRVGGFTIIKNMLVIDLYCTNCGGGSSAIPETRFLNGIGDSLFDLSKLNFTKDFSYDGYEVENNKLIIYTTTVGYLGDLEPSYDCYFREMETGEESIDGLKAINGNNYDKYAKMIAKEEYVIEYLGKGKFSEPQKRKEYEFGELYTKEHCIKEYEDYKQFKKEYGN
ncbi:MAG: hypothetical protein GX864_04695 [Mollicutes bacterium]|jgi:hypothetical protein|nr:hypothetical protein [Mollicutes bacterium]